MVKQKQKFDVFISHASADKIVFVDRLYNSLTDRGLNCFYDSNIRWGSIWPKEIDQAIDCSKKAIFVISPSFISRKWPEYELNRFFARQRESGMRVVYPIAYRISISDIITAFPFLSDIQMIQAKYINSDADIDEIACKFKEEFDGDNSK